MDLNLNRRRFIAGAATVAGALSASALAGSSQTAASPASSITRSAGYQARTAGRPG